MKSIRRGTFETNSSSTHSVSIPRSSRNYHELRDIFDEILYDVDGASDYEDIVNVLEKLHRAQEIILNGTEEY